MKQYWNLRSDFLKRFIVIGTNDGNSLPIASLDQLEHWGTPCGQNSGLGIARFGDKPQLLGYYIASLSTEYALLKQRNQSTVANLNELYYAIEAINRLDRNAEQYSCSGARWKI